MKNYIFTFLIGLTFLFTGCGDEVDSSAFVEKKPFEEKTYKLTTLENETIEVTSKEFGMEFKDFKDKKVVFVNIFATWCPPCIKEIPDLKELQEKYNDDFQIIAVLFKDDKTKEQMKEFKEQYGINYTITYGDENLRLASEVYDIQKVPEMFMYTKSGVLVQKFVGETKADVIEAYLKQALNYDK